MRRAPYHQAARARLSPGRGWTINAVGESNFQKDIQAIYRSLGGTEHDVKATAALVPEDRNQFDANAVRIEIKNRTVAYLSQAMAAEYRSALGSTIGECAAKIVGGYMLDDGTKAHFGIKLNMSWPPRIKSPE